MTEPIPLTPRQIYERAYYEANKEKIRAYYAANKTQIAEKKRAWKEANKEKRRAWIEANKDSINEKYDVYYEANKDTILAKGRAWCKANPEALRNKKARRNAVPGEITPGWIPKLLELQRWTCVVCNVDLRFGYHIDHIQPIARGGENTDYNLQALCPKCNLEKSDKDPIEFIQSRGFLI